MVIVARFAEKTVVDNIVDIELIKERVAVFRDGGGKDYNLIQLADALHEFVDAGSLNDIDVVEGAFDFNGDGKVGLAEELRWGSQILVLRGRWGERDEP